MALFSFFRFVLCCIFRGFWLLLGSLWCTFGTFWVLFESFLFRGAKQVSPNRCFCFLVPADPREPRFSSGPIQFCANQRFSGSLAVLVQTCVQHELFFQTFQMYFRYMFRRVFWCHVFQFCCDFWAPFWTPVGSQRGEHGWTIGFFSDTP